MQPDDDKTQIVTMLSKGTVAGHYRIIERIGAGGMGEVYLADDTELNRKVALKFLSPHLCQDADCRARFKREAQAAAKLNHPNIVTIYEVSEFNGRPFFAMEYVEGLPLSEMIRQGDCPLDRVIDLSLQICEGLQEAHKAGITHRDVKPANILVNQLGRAKVVDLGLASVAGADKLTKEGSTLGTLGYMSPEQVQGKPTDQRSDLFSLGVVLYELISCKSPFKGETPAATMNAIAQRPAEPLARYKAGVPDELQRIVSKLLQKDQALRYQTAADVISDLTGLKATSQSQMHIPAKKKRTRRLAVGGAVLVLLVVVAYGIFKSNFFSGEKPTQRKMLAVLPFENLGSPDDEYFADGMTDEITAKLAVIHDLGVISRTSTMLYKHTTKNLRDIAKELGVDYVLEGTLLWDKGRDTSRVRILPQLIRVSDDTHLWAETYERPLTDIFTVQADIAASIAEALSITLAQSGSTSMRAMPTENLEAYQAYLRGMDYWRKPDAKKEELQLGVQMLQRAIELDSTFALAYAWLAISHAEIFHYGYDRTPERLGEAKKAADRAFELQPDLGWTHFALSYYYYWGFRDYDHALDELALAKAVLPNEPEISELNGYILRRQGKFGAACGELERAFQLNPRAANLAVEIAWSYLILREYELAEKFANSSISLEPDQINAYTTKAWICYLWQGDTVSARNVLSSIPVQEDEDTHLARFYQFLFERNYPAALHETASLPSVVVDLHHVTPKGWLSGMIYKLINEQDSAQSAFDSAWVILERELGAKPDDYRIPGSLGLVYAGLGRKQDAIDKGKLGVELLPVSKDAYFGPAQIEDLALIYVMVGEYDAALDQIEYLLSIPCDFSVPYLRLDPRYDPLRKLPRYQKLLEKYGT